ncbi:hypothetical protein LBMAG33_4020 [Candidatus Levyibacteriota bacterium]|nr:hypothetical protein LBMAG33_4020 [Candidatus Levybacteria bacterium]
MGSFGGFYKGEKKKPKKGKNNKSIEISTAPVFSLPKMIEKKRKDE